MPGTAAPGLKSKSDKVDTCSVSVIIPAFNAAASLRACIDSALKQSFAPCEIILVNDGSTDGTARVAREYGRRVVLLEQRNAGQGAARNAGLKVAKGAHIAFLDADDYWKPKFLEKCLQFLEANPGCAAVNTGLITRMHDGREIIQPELLTRPDAPKTPFIIDNFYAFWAQNDHVRTGSAVIRKSVIDKAGGQREDLRVSQDLEYWGYIGTFGRWGYIPEPLWVGNSRAAAQAPGWIEKYRKRRKLCPTVETWQQRIVPRLTNYQWPHFRVVRGRVAAGYAQNHILGGNPGLARRIVRIYGNEMPVNRLTRLLKLGNCLGAVGWWLASHVVRGREHAKSIAIKMHGRRSLK